jgi:hypothetical protein
MAKIIIRTLIKFMQKHPIFKKMKTEQKGKNCKSNSQNTLRKKHDNLRKL